MRPSLHLKGGPSQREGPPFNKARHPFNTYCHPLIERVVFVKGGPPFNKAIPLVKGRAFYKGGPPVREGLLKGRALPLRRPSLFLKRGPSHKEGPPYKAGPPFNRTLHLMKREGLLKGRPSREGLPLIRQGLPLKGLPLALREGGP